MFLANLNWKWKWCNDHLYLIQVSVKIDATSSCIYNFTGKLQEKKSIFLVNYRISNLCESDAMSPHFKGRREGGLFLANRRRLIADGAPSLHITHHVSAWHITMVMMMINFNRYDYNLKPNCYSYLYQLFNLSLTVLISLIS